MHHFLQETVESVMTRQIQTITPEITIGELQRLFDQYGYNMFPVVEGEHLLGVVSEFDFLRAFIFDNRAPVPRYGALLAKPVSAICAKDIMTVRPHQPLTRVLELMVETRCKSFPVVDDSGRLVGIIARRDLIHRLPEERPNA